MNKLILTTVSLAIMALSLNGQRSEVLGGAAPLDFQGVCITNEQRVEIQQRLQESIAQLTEDGLLPTIPSSRSQVLFQFPMDWNTGFDDYGFYGISNYVDHDDNYPGSIEDYNCGTRSYDTQSGYNHAGIDYYLWPFSWNLVEAGAVKAVAVAPGVIISKADGHEHYSCALGSNPWNAVYLMHEDGTTTWYGHLKKNSTTQKSIGESVEAGEYLGIIASSGNSTAPHLHFETYGSSGALVDPYEGNCNSTVSSSLWADQHPYYDPMVNKIQTHFAPPEFMPCPEQAITNEADSYQPGEVVYFVTYFRDQRFFDICQFSIFQPDGTVFDAWTFNQPQQYLSSSYWYWNYILPQDAQEGTWAFQCVFAGRTYMHEFTVTSDVAATSAISSDDMDIQTSVYKDRIDIDLTLSHPVIGSLLLSDITGRELNRLQVDCSVGVNRISLPVSNLQSGVYVLSFIVEIGGGVMSKKVIVK